MKNKTLVWVTALPVIVFFFCGLLSITVPQGTNDFLGLWIIVLGGWSLIRLNNTPDVKK